MNLPLSTQKSMIVKKLSEFKRIFKRKDASKQNSMQSKARTRRKLNLCLDILVDILHFQTRKKLCQLQCCCLLYKNIIDNRLSTLHSISQLKIEDRLPLEPQISIFSNKGKWIPLDVTYELMNTYIQSPAEFVRFREIRIDVELESRLPIYIKQFIVDSSHAFKNSSLHICNYSAIFISTKLFFGTAFNGCAEINLDLRTSVNRVLTYSDNKNFDGKNFPYDLWYDYEHNRKKIIEWLYSSPSIKRHISILADKAPRKLIDEIVEQFKIDCEKREFSLEIGIISGNPIQQFVIKNEETMEMLDLKEEKTTISCLYNYKLLRYAILPFSM